MPGPRAGSGTCSPCTTWPTRASSRRSLSAQLGLPDYLFGIDGIEFYGQVSFMKAGLQFADRITTVSPTYAREILTPEQGCGLDGLLRVARAALSGILNGVDYRGLESRARTRCCRSHYDAGDSLESKAGCKARAAEASWACSVSARGACCSAWSAG